MIPPVPSHDISPDVKGNSKWPLTRIFPSRAEMISPIIRTRSSYLYVLSVSHTASRIVRISLLINLECQEVSKHGVCSPWRQRSLQAHGGGSKSGLGCLQPHKEQMSP